MYIYIYVVPIRIQIPSVVDLTFSTLFFSVNNPHEPPCFSTCTFSPDSSSTAAAKVATFLPTNKTQTSRSWGERNARQFQL